MKPNASFAIRWLPLSALILSWLALWLTGLWLKPPPVDEAIAVVRVNDVYLDGRRFACRHLSESMAFDLACTLTLPAGTLLVEARTDDGTVCTATWGDAQLACRVRGFGYFNRLAEVSAPSAVSAALAPGDVTLVALGLSEQIWLPIGLVILAVTSLLVLATAWAWMPPNRWRPLTATLVSVALWPLNLYIVVAHFAGLAMID